MTAAAERGTTTVTERAVRRIAGRAAAEALPGEAGARATKCAASVRGRRARLALGLALPYPAPLADTARRVQEHVAARTRELSGLGVPAARIEVTALSAETAGADAAAPGDAAGPGPSPATARAPRRLWSRRGLPVAGIAAAGALVCGALTADLVRVHTAHRPASAWRVSAVHWLAGHGPGDPSVVAAGALTALLGLWLVVLAVTPGLRHRSTLRAPAPRVVAAVDRTAVESLVRDAVGEVAGVGPVRVRARRRRVAVRAGLLFGERADARAAVTAAAGGALATCGLRRSPRLRVKVTPEAVWQPPQPDTETVRRREAPVLGGVTEGKA
ncbi:DUF6286 domain-containing Asp23/Gls24 family envelope stress response protein [Streptomyces bungoensis]